MLSNDLMNLVNLLYIIYISTSLIPFLTPPCCLQRPLWSTTTNACRWICRTWVTKPVARVRRIGRRAVAQVAGGEVILIPLVVVKQPFCMITELRRQRGYEQRSLPINTRVSTSPSVWMALYKPSTFHTVFARFH